MKSRIKNCEHSFAIDSDLVINSRVCKHSKLSVKKATEIENLFLEIENFSDLVSLKNFEQK